MILISRPKAAMNSKEQMFVAENTAASHYELGHHFRKGNDIEGCSPITAFRGELAYLYIDKKWSVWSVESEIDELARTKSTQRTSCVDWIGLAE